MIIDRIRAMFPAHRIIAEEAGLLDPAVPGGNPASGAAGGRTGLVDPLDGTNNLAVRLPAYIGRLTRLIATAEGLAPRLANLNAAAHW